MPERSCMGCGAKRPKHSLRRVVLGADGVPMWDAAQKSPGRGAYLCGPGCLKAALKRKAFQRAFRGKVGAEGVDGARLEAEMRPEGDGQQVEDSHSKG